MNAMNENNYTTSNTAIFHKEYNIPIQFNVGRNIYFGNWNISGIFYFEDIFEDCLPIIDIGKS